MKTKKQVREVGEFEVGSGMIVVSDPCYEGADQIKAKSGKWVGVVISRLNDWWGNGKPHNRTCVLLAFHDSMRGAEKAFISGQTPRGLSKQLDFRSVDSGQMSVFDSESYSEELYEECCNKSKGGGIVSGSGFVCDSGMGDGGYRVSVWKNEGETVAVTVKFLP